MNKVIAIVCVAVGLVLIVVGVNSMNSFGSDVSRFFTGAPTDKSVWMLLGGVLALLGGLGFGWRSWDRG